ncbi:hypothetical protein GCK72_002480 [Caenorhabditis remanei]|uniref:Uncharacterized protein n=1 Tax=Caenorhabditis remanei TaxID=31234 RepID=A0A6A5HSI0_CAERE|nr:hypothetical protein GCK72_002480 [Caenorhabditis remanei]KAF1770659.1 hypothetical protein GCK72_002480 [Caenorhabditis remanei]
MNPNERSKYLCDQYGQVLGEQLDQRKSQYVLADLNKNPADAKSQSVKKIDSEYILRDLQNQANKDQTYSRDAPDRPFLTGTPINAKDIRAKIESFDNAIVIPQIINGQVFFTTHGDADTHTAVDGSTSNPNLSEGNSVGATKGVDLHKVKFTFAQLVTLLGPVTCQRLEREFAKNNKLSDAEMAQLRTACESGSEMSLATGRSSETLRTAQSVEPNLLSTRTANSVEPNLLSVYSARSPGVFTKNEGVLTAQSPEPNLLSVRTANSLEPNLLSVRSARDFTTMSQLKAQSPGILTAQLPEPNLLSTRTARSATSLSDRESKDVLTAIEIDSPTTGVNTAKSIASGSTQSVFTANEIESIRSSQDVLTAVSILSDLSRSSQDVTTALEIPDNAGSQMSI